MLTKLLASALFAGFAAGLIAVALQFAFVQPILLEAELYESGHVEHFSAPEARAHDHNTSAETTGETTDPAAENATDHDHASHDHSARPKSGIDFKRDGLSVLFSVFTFVGFALIMVAGFAIAQSRDITITIRSGLYWGLAGFVAVQLAPAFGLGMDLPGNAAADLGERQIWWAATVVLTALGLWLVAFGKGIWPYAIAIALIALPHMFGAPHPDGFNGPAPPELSSLFATRSLGVSIVAWVSLGLFAAWFWTQEDT